MHYLTLLGFFLLLFLSSCQEQFLYKKTIRLEEQWSYNDSLRFEIPITDTTRLYELSLDVEHTKDYPFQNIYTYFTTQYPSGAHNNRVVNIDFADQTGQWYGKCGRETCRLSVVLQQNAYFNELGTHIVTVAQFTRQAELKGLRSFTFKMRDIQKRR
jgi:gliding motility-associated lipoprotein GldH